MVKGVSRQVIVVQSPEPKMFEQAIFILKEDALSQEGITDDALLQEAKRLLRSGSGRKRTVWYSLGPLWAAAGSLATGLVWLLTALV